MIDARKYNDILNLSSSNFEEEVKNLDSLLDKYPYFQSARVLQLKLYKQLNDPRYNQALKKAAAHTTDRDVLFNFISSENFNKKKEELLNEAIEPIHDEIEDTEENNIEEVVLTEELESNIEVDLEKETPEEILEIKKPLSFNKDDKYSFSEWLKLTQKKKIQRDFIPEEEENSDESEISSDEKANNTEKVITLVDEFLKNRPRPSRRTSISEERELELEAFETEAPQSLMTETLARVYLQQKNYNKAIQAYKILILKNPEKSGYFADKIRAIEKILNKN